MANTFKFGNKKWATKKDSILAYNDENNNFKPLPFDFSRSSSATVVNEQGLIETIGSNVPRVDYLNDTDGSLLLEPQRTNLLPYSEDYSQSVYTRRNCTINQNYGISPSGLLDATLVSANGSDAAIFDNIGITSGNTYVLSVYLRVENGTLDTTISLGSAGFPNTSGDGGRVKDITVTTEWQRFTLTSTADANAGSDIGIIGGFGGFNSGDEVLIWGAQLEVGSYATSYIPTSGSAITRVADGTSQTPPNGVIGQTEGTIYFESTINGLQGGDMRFQLSDGSTNNWFFLSSGEATGIGVKARAYINNGNINQFNSYSAYLSEGNHKYALAYNLNDIAFYVDGVQVALDNSATIPSCDEITLSGNTPTSINASHFISYKDIKLYNTRLSNAELQALTT